jgi:hypothetical protein
MSTAFIISQIGNPELDSVCSHAIVPALKACGLDPKRVDKHNKGGLLKSEIIGFIESADIIVADLTNERPNCYLEVGYAMGVDKFRNLILTAREDHNHDSRNHLPGGPKIHFDLIGYDVLFWHPDHLDDFKSELEKRIKRRLAILAPSASTLQSAWDSHWLEQHRSEAKQGLLTILKTPHPGYCEIEFALSGPKPNVSQRDLLGAAKGAQIHTFGWPIGAVLDNRDEYRPRPSVDGIVANMPFKEHSSHDYWALRRNGDFYLLQSLFEDMRDPSFKTIYFNTRIVRITEALLYCARLYSRLGVLNTRTVNIGVVHGGLRDRILRSSDPVQSLFGTHSTTQDVVRSEISASLISIESQLVQFVKDLTQPLFMIFDYFEVSDSVYANMVNNFVEGRTR